MDLSRELQAKRVVAFACAFQEANASWLVQLAREVSLALSGFPEHVLGANGQDLMADSFKDTALCYASIQVMRCKPRCDPEHFDGGSSLLHAGLTIYGRRAVSYQEEGGRWARFTQEPGDI